MTHLLNCPVCGYKEITSNTCPNCDTDISLIRSLTELSPIEEQQVSQKATKWQAGVALLMLLVGICLGALGSFLFMQPNQLSITSNSSARPAVESKSKIPTDSDSIAQADVKPEQPTQYTVKPGDNLSAITEKLCGKGKAWQLMVQANPQLKSRPNLIEVDEVLNVPNCGG